MAINAQAVRALISATVVLIVFGSIYTFGALTPYISSYLYYKGNETSSTALSVLFTLTIITINVGATVSALVLNKFSNKLLCIIAVLGMSSAVFFVSFMENFIGFVAFYGVMYGLFIGIGYLPPLQNAYLHLPTRKGLCSGICMSGFGLGSAIFNYIILELVNPHNIELDKETKRYPQQIANNLPFALKILGATYFGVGMLSSIFITPPKNKIKMEQSVLSQKNIQQQMQNVAQNNRQSLFQFFIRKKAHFLMLQVALIAPFGMFMAFNYKRLAFQRNPYFLQNDHLVTTIGSIGIFCNGLFRTVWGYLFDHISFKKIVITINCCLLVFCGCILFAVQNAVAYSIIIPCIYLTYGGLYAILPTQMVRLLGHKKGGKIFWLAFAGFSTASVVQFTLQYFVLTYAKQNGYYYCIGVFFLFETIGLILSAMQEQKLLVKKNKEVLVQQQNNDDYVS